MNKTRLYELAYSFRGAKLWKQLSEEELFAIRVPAYGVCYCHVMGGDGRHKALAVYPGERGFSTYREFCDALNAEGTDPYYVLIQDCLQCSLEQRDMFDPEALAELKAYCERRGTAFRAPFPKFMRYRPFCFPWEFSDDRDWKTMEIALRVAEKMSEVVKRSGKAALGLRSVYVSTDDETYGFEQLDMFSTYADGDEVTIPLYTVEKNELSIERVPLPPYKKREIAPPRRIDEKALEKLKRRKQKGVYECELIRLPEPVDGEPPYFPVVLLTLDESGFLLPAPFSTGPMLNADEMLKDFIDNLGKAYPKAIRVRTEETKTLLEGFCKRANILLVLTDDLEYMDEAIEGLIDQMTEDDEYDFDDEDDDEDGAYGDERDDIIAMLEALSVAEIRRMPEHVLDQILAMAEYFPAEIIEKVRRAKRK